MCDYQICVLPDPGSPASSVIFPGKISPPKTLSSSVLKDKMDLQASSFSNKLKAEMLVDFVGFTAKSFASESLKSETYVFPCSLNWANLLRDKFRVDRFWCILLIDKGVRSVNRINNKQTQL